MMTLNLSLSIQMDTMILEESENPMTGIRPRQSDKYYGQRDFLLLGNWIFSVDQFFILTDMPAHEQGPSVSTLLRDEALLWFRSNYENWDPAIPLSWPILRAAIREYFAPPNEDRHLQGEWQISNNIGQSLNMCQLCQLWQCESKDCLRPKSSTSLFAD